MASERPRRPRSPAPVPTSVPGLVSVLMPLYNAEQYVGRAIQSLMAQSYERWELVLVEDGSTDGSRDVVDRYPDPRMKVTHQANAGESAARNAALSQAEGQFLAFLDADDVYLPNHLELTVGHLLAHPELGGVYTDGYYCDQSENLLQTLSSRRRGPFEGRLFEQVVRGPDVFGPPVCVVLRSRVVRQYGLRFDERIVIGPDWDFFTQFTDKADFGYVDQKTCLYRIHSSSISTRTDLQKRARHLAQCRMKAVKMPSFGSCSVEARYEVFYDLLVNLLRGFPERQAEVTRWPEFEALPPAIQGKLLRLMASRSLLNQGGQSSKEKLSSKREQERIGDWIRRSRDLNPADWRAALLSAAHRLSPLLCKGLLAIKYRRQIDPMTVPPLADLKKIKP